MNNVQNYSNPIASMDVDNKFRLLTQINQYISQNQYKFNGVPKFDLSDREGVRLKIQQAALDGQSATTGSALRQINYIPGVFSQTGVYGNAFVQAGIQYFPNSLGEIQHMNSVVGTNVDGYIARTKSAYTDVQGAPIGQNDVTAGVLNRTITLLPYFAEAAVDDLIEQGLVNNGDFNAFLQALDEDLARKQTLLHDRIVFNAMALGSTPGTFITAATSVIDNLFALTQTMYNNGITNFKYMMNVNSYIKLLNSKTAGSGEFLLSTYNIGESGVKQNFTRFTNNTTDFGTVAQIFGHDIIVVPAIANTFSNTMSFTGVNLTSVTGGTSSLIMAFDPNMVGLAVGKEKITHFSDTDSYELRRRGVVKAIIRDVKLGAALANPIGAALVQQA